MPYVPAHTSAFGNNALMPSTSWVFSSVPPGSQTTSTSTVIHAQSFRQVPQNGIFHPDYPRFRKATPWTRCVMRSYDLSNGVDFYILSSSTGQPTSRYTGSDSRHSAGLSPKSPGVSFGSTGPSVSLNTRNRAETEALVKVRNSKVNLSTSVFEARTTIAGVATRAVTLLRTVRALRRGNFGQAYRILFGLRNKGLRGYTGSAADLWLEWQYGWRPLISDIWAGIELVRKGFEDKRFLFSVERTVRTDLSNLRDYFQTTSPMNNIIVSGKSWESSKVVFWGALKNAQLHDLEALGLLNPLSLVWELTSLSFVIDWLVPVGTWLESLTATSGIDFVDGHRTDMIYGNVVGTNLKAGSINGALSRAGVLPRVRVKVMAMKRTTYSSWPWAVPYWVNPLTSTHTASAAALLRSRS